MFKRWVCLRKFEIQAESDQFYCHLLLKVKTKNCAGNTGDVYWAEGFCLFVFNIYMITFTTYRNIDIPIDQLIIIYRYEIYFLVLFMVSRPLSI